MSGRALLDAAAIEALLASAGGTRRLCVAFSGGPDSTALLHRLAALREALPGVVLRAVHVDHGLQPDAARWAVHCRDFCAAIGVSFDLRRVDAGHAKGESPEAAARAARYRALAAQLGAGEVLLTAHTADDQAETLLLQLLRGAGPAGLASMPALKRFAHGWHGRPLLGIERVRLQRYCEEHRLRHVDDPSNRDPEFDRALLRARVLPVLGERWPAVATTLARAAGHQAEAARLLDDLARLDLGTDADEETLPVAVLCRLDPPRRRNALRSWLARRGASMPSTAQLACMLDDVVDARVDAEPAVSWGGFELRRHGGRLHLLRGARDVVPARCPWPAPFTELDFGEGRLVASPRRGAGVRVACLASGSVEVRRRSGGERIRPAGDRHTRALKKLLQASGLPPWQRRSLPLVYVDERLVAVPGVCIAEGCAADAGEDGVELCWSPARVASA